MVPVTRLFVGNLPENTKDEDIVSAFSNFGKVTNLDLNIKTEAGKESTKFAFVSLSAPNVDVESCIKHFSNEEFHGTKLYVTVARESFLEKLQRKQDEAQKKDKDDKLMCQENLHQKKLLRFCDNINSDKLNRSVKWSWRTNIQCQLMQHNDNKKIPLNISEKLKCRKRKIEHNITTEIKLKTRKHKDSKLLKDVTKQKYSAGDIVENKIKNTSFVAADGKKLEAKKKLLESMKKTRQNFKEKETIPSSLTLVDEVQNKRVKFPDFDDLLKQLENDKKVRRQVTIHWIRVHQNARILHRHKQDLHANISLASTSSD